MNIRPISFPSYTSLTASLFAAYIHIDRQRIIIRSKFSLDLY